jgi:integrase
MDFKEDIKKLRPTLSDSSVTTYNSILKSIHKKVFGEHPLDIANFEKHVEVLKHLEDMAPNKRKTILSALVVVSKDPKPYRSQMLEDIKTTAVETAKQEKTEEQKEHWILPESIASLYGELKAEADHIYKKKDRTMADLQKIQNFVIISLFHLIPPRRAKDYCDFKIKNIDKSVDNWFDEKASEVVMVSYKTSKFYGEQRVKVDKLLKSILKKWIAINPTDYLLFDSISKKLSPVKLNQRLNKMFGSDKGCSVNGLRHSYLSNKYQDTIAVQNAMKKDMSDMGSSLAQSSTYIQKE